MKIEIRNIKPKSSFSVYLLRDGTYSVIANSTYARTRRVVGITLTKAVCAYHALHAMY